MTGTGTNHFHFGEEDNVSGFPGQCFLCSGCGGPVEGFRKLWCPEASQALGAGLALLQAGKASQLTVQVTTVS